MTRKNIIAPMVSSNNKIVSSRFFEQSQFEQFTMSLFYIFASKITIKSILVRRTVSSGGPVSSGIGYGGPVVSGYSGAVNAGAFRGVVGGQSACRQVRSDQTLRFQIF